MVMLITMFSGLLKVKRLNKKHGISIMMLGHHILCIQDLLESSIHHLISLISHYFILIIVEGSTLTASDMLEPLSAAANELLSGTGAFTHLLDIALFYPDFIKNRLEKSLQEPLF